MAAKAIEVIEPGPLALVQDSGRLGHMAVGAGRAGAADRASYELGGRLLGNPDGLAAIEVTFGGLQIRARGDVMLCLTGAQAPGSIGSRGVPYAAPFHLHEGEELRLSMPPTGLRTYVSFRGGLALEQVLGSASTDTMSGLGPAPLQAGDVLEIGDVPKVLPHVDVAPVRQPGGGAVTLRVTPGSRRDWFADPTELATTPWAVSARSDRKGIRLTGGVIGRRKDLEDAEVPSEGMVRGAIQVPPNGEPVVFLNDHPVTGGYPVIAVVRSADVDLAAQLTPGQQVLFRWEKS